MQRTLKDLGYYDTKCTGKMLLKTVKAVKAFQKDHGMYANGGVNQEVIDRLVDAAKKKARATKTPAPEAIATPAP